MTWQTRASKIEIGDNVCFKTSHLFASGLMRSELPHLSGKVIGIEGEEALMEWDSPHDQPLIVTHNFMAIGGTFAGKLSTQWRSRGSAGDRSRRFGGRGGHRLLGPDNRPAWRP
jgi:hypothetical protein